MNMNKLIECLRQNKRFLITTHKNPEGDAIGSEMALFYLLKRLKKQVVIVNSDELPQTFNFLKRTESIRTYKKNMKIKFDIAIALDCADISRCGQVADLITAGTKIINIDHHISNTQFGMLNWVNPVASSTTEMLCQLYKRMGLTLDKNSATALYVGILTDTGSFRYSNTSPFVHQIAAQLLKFNLDVAQIYSRIYESASYSDMKLLLRVFRSMRKEAGGRIISFEIKSDELKKVSRDFDLSEHVLNFGRKINNCEVCVFFREEPRKGKLVRVNLRSRNKVNVNHVARIFGGGGHTRASGAAIQGSLQSVKQKVIKEIKEQL